MKIVITGNSKADYLRDLKMRRRAGLISPDLFLQASLLIRTYGSCQYFTKPLKNGMNEVVMVSKSAQP